MIESTTDAIADDPAHSAMRNPTETTSARPRVRMLEAVGAMSWSTTSGVNTRWANPTILPSTMSTVSGPNQPPT